MSDLVRHLRQVMLPELGEAGQSRLDRAVLPVGGEGLAHEVATRYALGAGAAGVVPGPLGAESRVPAWVEHEPAAGVLAGARAALAAIRVAALGEGRP